MSKSIIKRRLENLDSEKLINLIEYLMNKEDHTRMHILEWLDKDNCIGKKKSYPIEIKSTQDIQEALLFEYWSNAQVLISEFNEYGGGPDDEEAEAYEWLEKISHIFKTYSLSLNAKKKFINSAFIEYDANNSGFDDVLIDLFFELCKEKEEWEYLILKLEHKPSECRKGIIMTIYKDYLEDDSKYLQERVKTLCSGWDYWDLVQYYVSKHNINLAIETALTGIKKGEGGLAELYKYLISHYAKKQDEIGLEMVEKIAIQRKNDERFVFDLLFQYYKSIDYSKAKEKLLLSYQHHGYSGYFEEYKRIKSFLSESDWIAFEPRIIHDAQKNSLTEYLDICLFKGMKETVIKIITTPPKNHWGFINFSNFDSFAEELEKDYPKEIIEYYYKQACRKIENGNRKAYKEGVLYIRKVKSIYLNIMKDNSGWEEVHNKLLDKFRNRPALLDELKKGKI